MIRGTTPTHTFKLPSSIDNIKSVRILYVQDSKIILKKEIGDCQIVDNSIIVKLTQEDTLTFDCNHLVEIQLRILTTNGDSLVSNITKVSVGKCLDKDVIE